MTSLFWGLSTDPEKQAASQAVLMVMYYKLTGEKLQKPPDSYLQPIVMPPDIIELAEIAILKEMSKPPHSPRRIT